MGGEEKEVLWQCSAGRDACLIWGEGIEVQRREMMNSVSTTSPPSTLQTAASNSAKNTWSWPFLDFLLLVVLLLGWRLPKAGEILADRCQMAVGVARGGTGPGLDPAAVSLQRLFPSSGPRWACSSGHMQGLEVQTPI